MSQNLSWSVEILNQLKQQEVTFICYGTGARNAPLLIAAQQIEGFQLKSFVDERSAAFFALGLARKYQKPVIVCTTSGTAVAELIPAAQEALYSEVPLVFLTADRPKRFRGSGAPQSIDQVSFFKPCVSQQWDLSLGESPDKNFLYPCHLNLCFDEPLFGEREDLRCQKRLPWSGVKRPLVILGDLSQEDQESVAEFLEGKHLPVVVEAHSGFSKNQFPETCISVKSQSVSVQHFPELFDGVLRIGGIPTCRIWRDLEYKLASLPVANFSRRQWSGLSDVSFVSSLEELKTWDWRPSLESSTVSIQKLCKSFEQKLQGAIEKYPLSEVSLLKKLGQIIPNKSQVFLSNSLPVREWDLVFPFEKQLTTISQRGVNGIDGLMSTYLAMLDKDVENIFIMGDLSAVYDTNAFWIFKDLSSSFRIKFVIINNFGGRIFRQMFSEEILQSEHQFSFENYARLWGVKYRLSSSLDEKWEAFSNQMILEIQPNLSQSDAFWKHLS